jgi:MFS family permease
LVCRHLALSLSAAMAADPAAMAAPAPNSRVSCSSAGQQQQQQQRQQSSLNRISLHMLLRVTIGCMGLAAEPLFVRNLCGGDASRAMRLLAQTSGASGLVQFVFNPTFGTLSDTFGRRVFFMVGPLTNAIGNLLASLFPSNLPLFACTRVICKAMATLSGSTVCAAALSDCASGDALSVAHARLGSCASLGVVLGPLMGTAMLGRGMAVTSVYLVQSLAGFLHAAIVAFLIRETLPRSDRRPFLGALPLSLPALPPLPAWFSSCLLMHPRLVAPAPSSCVCVRAPGCWLPGQDSRARCPSWSCSATGGSWA